MLYQPLHQHTPTTSTNTPLTPTNRPINHPMAVEHQAQSVKHQAWAQSVECQAWLVQHQAWLVECQAWSVQHWPDQWSIRPDQCSVGPDCQARQNHLVRPAYPSPVLIIPPPSIFWAEIRCIWLLISNYMIFSPLYYINWIHIGFAQAYNF